MADGGGDRTRSIRRFAPVLIGVTLMALLVEMLVSSYVDETTRRRAEVDAVAQFVTVVRVGFEPHVRPGGTSGPVADEALLATGFAQLDMISDLSIWGPDGEQVWSSGPAAPPAPASEDLYQVRDLGSDLMIAVATGSGADRLEYTGRIPGAWFEEHWEQRRSGVVATVRSIIAAVWAVVGIMVITWTLRLERAADENERQARLDPLTRLPNRAELARVLEHRLATSDEPFAVLLMDLDGFKRVNDTLGHNHGDQLLEQVAHRLGTVPGDGDMLARLGGDEFAVYAPSIGDAEGALAMAMHFSIVLRRPFEVGGHHVDVDVSVGAALYPDHGHDRHDLLKAADVAMYHAKAMRTRAEVYDPGIDPHSAEQLSLTSQLRTACRGDELFVVYQPLQRLRGAGPNLYEALLRWNHPTRGVLAPGDFLDLGEQAGMTTEITRVVLRLAVSQCAEWVRSGHDTAVSVNVFPTNIADPTFAAEVADILAGHDLDPDRLVLEVTERSELDLGGSVPANLATLSQLGVRVAIDDFGAGAWSLAHVRRLHVSMLKLDRQLVREAAIGPADRAVIEAATAMAHKLGLEVVAEGIETARELEMVQTAGVDLAQGYFLSRPLAAADVVAYERFEDELTP